MDGTTSTGLYPLHRTKTIHLVRHAQGIHNVAGDKDYNAYRSEELFDADLTPLGWKQVANLRNHVEVCGLDKKIKLVITSPLSRTIQTAVGVFRGEAYSGVNAAPPILAVEFCRERLGVHPCDRRRNVTELKAAFRAIDFSLIENEEDVLWKPDVRETDEELATRGAKVIDWLWTRTEKEIAIVSHGGLLCNTLRKFGQDCHPSIRREISNKFSNCELRSIVLVGRSMMGMEGSIYNYPGNIPSGVDKPTDDFAA